MRTSTPTKAISYFQSQLESRLRRFSGSFADMNQVMMRDFAGIFKKTCMQLIKGKSIDEAIALSSQIFAESASRLRELLSTFGNKMQEVALSIKSKNPNWTTEEINKELIRRTRDRIAVISHTEISRLNSELQEAQAVEIGYEYFVWHTKKDKNVGEDHKILEGAIFRLDDLPVQGFPQRSRPNCRCQAEFLNLTESKYRLVRQRQIARGIDYEI